MRQLCYLAAVMADERGFKAAQTYIAMIKVAAPRAVLRILDEAIQVHGAHGVSQDSRLAEMWTHMRTLRVADGLQVSASAKVAAFAPEHRHLEIVIGFKISESFVQGVGRFAVNGVSFFWAGQNDGQHSTIGLGVYRRLRQVAS